MPIHVLMVGLNIVTLIFCFVPPLGALASTEDCPGKVLKTSDGESAERTVLTVQALEQMRPSIGANQLDSFAALVEGYRSKEYVECDGKIGRIENVFLSDGRLFFDFLWVGPQGPHTESIGFFFFPNIAFRSKSESFSDVCGMLESIPPHQKASYLNLLYAYSNQSDVFVDGQLAKILHVRVSNNEIEFMYQPVGVNGPYALRATWRMQPKISLSPS